MIPRSRNHVAALEGVVIVSIVVLLVTGEAAAERTVNGQLYLTYQENNTPRFSQRALLQHYEATLRDRIYDTTNLVVSLYLDNSKDLSRDQTILRYRGQLDLDHRYYAISARFAPRQKITPLELETSEELTENQLSLHVRVPEYPQLRLFFGRRLQYADGAFTGYARDIRADAMYQFKILEVKLNRWEEKSENKFDSRTVVTGGSTTLSKTFGRLLSMRTGYEYQLTESLRDPGITTSVTNQTVTALFTGNYRNIVSGSVSLITRRLDTENALRGRSRNDTHTFLVNFFPRSPLQLNLSRSYLLSKQDTAKTLADYATAQLVFKGELRKNTTGRAQVARRFVIQSTQGAIPANLYYLSLRSIIMRGVDVRADLSVSQRDKDAAVVNRYQTVSLLDVYLRPRESLVVSPSVQFIKYSDRLSLLRNDRRAFGLTANYMPRRPWNAGVDFRRTVIASGRQQENLSAVVNLGFTLRKNSSVNISYGINEIDVLAEPAPGQPSLDSRGSTINIQTQFWVQPKGSLALNYSRSEQDNVGDTDYISITYRHDF